MFYKGIHDNGINKTEHGRKTGTVRSDLHLLRVTSETKQSLQKTYVYSNTAIKQCSKYSNNLLKYSNNFFP